MNPRPAVGAVNTMNSRTAVGADTMSPSPILLNGEQRTIPAGCSVAQLIAELGLEGRRVAVAVNRDVIPRSRFTTATVAAGDHVEILEAVGGGA